MSKPIDDSGPAFPVPDGEAANMGCHGLSIRDWFAGQALAGLGTWTPGDQNGFPRRDTHTARAEWAYASADAMLAHRNKETSND